MFSQQITLKTLTLNVYLTVEQEIAESHSIG